MAGHFKLANSISTDPTDTTGFHLAGWRCPLLSGALILLLEKRLFDAVINKIPGQFFIRIALAENIKVRVYGYCLKGLGPVAFIGMGH